MGSPANDPPMPKKAPKNLLKVEDPLPITFDVAAKEKDRKPNQEACNLCNDKFTKMVVGKNPIRHCKRCARSVCDVCSLTRRQLSRSDPEKYRTCD